MIILYNVTHTQSNRVGVALHRATAPAPHRTTTPYRYWYPYRYGKCPRGGSYFTKDRTGPCGLIGATSVGYFGPQRGHLGGGPQKT